MSICATIGQPTTKDVQLPSNSFSSTYEAFPVVISLLTAAHIRDWKMFTEIIEDKTLDDLRTIAAHAIGMLYAATMAEAQARSQDYLDFLSYLSIRGQQSF